MPACIDCSALMGATSGEPHAALRQIDTSYGPGPTAHREFRTVYSCTACGARLAYRITVGNPWANGWELLDGATEPDAASR